MTENIFISYICVSLVCTVISAFLALVRPLTRRVFSAKWHYLITSLTIMLMLFPVRIDLPDKQYTGIQNSIATANEIPADTVHVTPTIVQGAEPQSDLLQLAEKYAGILSVIWLSVAAVMLAWHFVSYLVFIRKVKRDTYVCDCPALSEYTLRKVTVRKGKSVISPYTTGVIRPMLVLPESDIPEESLRHILAHEATHINCCDMFFKWLSVMAKCIHWFNPAVYILCKRLADLCEISCDSAVVKNMDSKAQISYMNTIMALVSAGKTKSSVLTTALSGKAKILKRRFLMIKDKPKVTKTATVISVIIAVSLLCTGVFASGILGGIYAPKANNTVENTVNEDEKPTLNNDIAENPVEAPNTEADSKQTFIWPCDSEEITAPFTPEKNHLAADIKSESGSEVYAPFNATVADTGFDSKDGNYIKLVAVDTEAYFAHLQETSVETGDTVDAGDVIGKVGNTGMATGPHLHYSLSIDGEYVDPATQDSVKLVIIE